MWDFIVGNWIAVMYLISVIVVCSSAFTYRYIIEPRLRDRVKEAEEDTRI